MERYAMSVSELARKPDPEIVSLLQDVLKDAQAGKLVGLVLLTNDSDGYRRWSAGFWSVQDALYLFEMWKHQVLFVDPPR